MDENYAYIKIRGFLLTMGVLGVSRTRIFPALHL